MTTCQNVSLSTDDTDGPTAIGVNLFNFLQIKTSSIGKDRICFGTYIRVLLRH